MIISHGFAARLTGLRDPRAAISKLWSSQLKLCAVTCGADGCYFASAERPGEVFFQPAFKIKAVDTTGCGDVFHGAYAAALGRGMGAAERIRFAAAAAALKATKAGGAQRGIPTLAKTSLLARKG